MNKFKLKVGRLISLIICLAFLLAISINDFPKLYGLMWLFTWALDSWFEIKLGQGFLKTRTQKVRWAFIITIFIYYCLPLEIANLEYVLLIKQAVNLGFAIFIIYKDGSNDDDDDDNKEDKKENRKVDKAKLRWFPTGA